MKTVFSYALFILLFIHQCGNYIAQRSSLRNDDGLDKSKLDEFGNSKTKQNNITIRHAITEQNNRNIRPQGSVQPCYPSCNNLFASGTPKIYRSSLTGVRRKRRVRKLTKLKDYVTHVENVSSLSDFQTSVPWENVFPLGKSILDIDDGNSERYFTLSPRNHYPDNYSNKSHLKTRYESGLGSSADRKNVNKTKLLGKYDLSIEENLDASGRDAPNTEIFLRPTHNSAVKHDGIRHIHHHKIRKHGTRHNHSRLFETGQRLIANPPTDDERLIPSWTYSTRSIPTRFIDESNNRVDHPTNRREKAPIVWPQKRVVEIDGGIILGGLMMVHERQDATVCGPVMPQGGIQALEAMLYTIDYINNNTEKFVPGVKMGALVLDDCDKDTYGLEQAVDFVKGKLIFFCFASATMLRHNIIDASNIDNPIRLRIIAKGKNAVADVLIKKERGHIFTLKN